MKDACYVMQQQLVFNMIFIHKVNAGPHYAITALTGLVSNKSGQAQGS